MLEGKKISELDLVTTLQSGCCFPLLSNGTTKRITYSSLLNKIENDLPDIDTEPIKEDVAELKVKTENIDVKLDTLKLDVKNYSEQITDVDELIESQNTTIRNCVAEVENLNQIIEDVHFEDVIALESQVMANKHNIATNTSNIEINANDIETNATNIETNRIAITTKLDKTTSTDNAGKFVSVDSNGNLFFNEISTCPIGYIYTQYPDQLSPSELFGVGTWEIIDYNGAFFRAEGDNASTFNSGVQSAELPNSRGTVYHIQSERGYSNNSPVGVFTVNNFNGNSDSGAANDRALHLVLSLSRGQTNAGGSTYVAEANSVYKDGGEVRPVNYTIKIWKRIA